jgi:hypothetical protein
MTIGHLTKPYIIVGMHRSGTSLVANVLNDAGIYMRALRDHNGESLPFLSANEQLMAHHAASWLQPVRITAQSDFSRNTMVAAHFQLPNAAGWRVRRATCNAWGFKDPRNTFTALAWLPLFTDARVIHVVRNADAVVRSLLVRQNRVGESLPALDASAAHDLWQTYTQEARSLATLLPNYIEVAYEDLCAGQSQVIARLSQFCGRNLQPYFAQRVVRKQL